MEHLTLKEATDFFSEFYFGEHHIPGYKPKEYGYGFNVIHDRGSLATFDFNELTRLVLMAHEQHIRVEISAHGKNSLYIAIWKRQSEGGMSERHPSIEQAIKGYADWKEKQTKK